MRRFELQSVIFYFKKGNDSQYLASGQIHIYLRALTV